ncbi:Mycolic acid cyclopropane synthase [Cynara cardunculus var. scolymus]|uniref:Mycolic acid cyclopropane synthase n=1 Tax=Cynara cardunculus var. scolymus TaxID=59895 RepID=A0A103XMM9_CYNCS|nr:Mycolic acid cyclopropane synthase [Cynara cardunculus var. scolymus]
MEISDMSFSVSLNEGHGYEWGNRNSFSSLFAQKVNVLNPCFLKMLKELTNFKDDVLRYLEELEHNQHSGRDETLSDFIQSHGYSELFQKAYLVPICSSIWPCPTEGVMRFSATSVLTYFRNHHLFQVKEELESRGCQIRTRSAVQSVSKIDNGCLIFCEDGSQEKYHGCIIDADAPDTLRMLGEEATHEEKRILGAFSYVYSDIVLHHDKNLMPRNQRSWSALNILGTKDNKVCLTYWLNMLQKIDDDDDGLPFLLTRNPSRTPKTTLLKQSMGQPIPTVAASKALAELNHIQGKRGIWFCGSYQGYGFHEDELKAGVVVANGMINQSYEFLNNPKQMVPSLMEAGARSLVVRFLRDYIAIGTLILLEDGGETFTFEGTIQKGPLKVYMKIHNLQFYWKIVTEADIGLADAYINGDFSFVDKTEGLLHMIMIFIVNGDLKTYASKSNKRGWWTPMFSTAIIASAKYFYHHSNELFALFLDETMTYSCAIFQNEDEDLKEAQMKKISLLIEKARVDKNHEVLEIGFGWGTLAIEIVKQTGCKYTGITLSKEQLKYAERKVKECGLQDQIKFQLCDYRQLPDTLKFDRIISCEVIEHVGHEYYEDFFRCCESLLVEDGIFVLQFISVQDGRYDESRRTPGFINEYIFPGGCLPSLNRLTSAMAASSRLSVDHVEKIGTHYYRTLRHWKTNFMKNKSKILSLGFNQEFILTWEYYFDYVAAGFKSETIGDYQVVFSRPGNVSTLQLGDPCMGVI